MLNASNSGSFTYPDDAYSGPTSSSLLCDRRILGLSDADRSDHWHLSPSAAPTAVRGRQILERLFSLAKIDNASAVAESLIDEFGSFAAVLYSDSRAAESNPGRAILSVVRDAMLISSKEKMVDRICLSKATDVIEYLIVAMARLILCDPVSTLTPPEIRVSALLNGAEKVQ